MADDIHSSRPLHVGGHPVAHGRGANQVPQAAHTPRRRHAGGDAQLAAAAIRAPRRAGGRPRRFRRCRCAPRAATTTRRRPPPQRAILRLHTTNGFNHGCRMPINCCKNADAVASSATDCAAYTASEFSYQNVFLVGQDDYLLVAEPLVQHAAREAVDVHVRHVPQVGYRCRAACEETRAFLLNYTTSRGPQKSRNNDAKSPTTARQDERQVHDTPSALQQVVKRFRLWSNDTIYCRGRVVHVPASR